MITYASGARVHGINHRREILKSYSKPAISFRSITKGRENGASLVEFSIVCLGVILVGMFTLQAGLLYHAKTTINYATFEAARAGAVSNGSLSTMRNALGMRLAPLQGGDGTEKRALRAITRSLLAVNDPINTQIKVLNPTKEAFQDWEVRDPVSGEYFIPVDRLRHQNHSVGKHSGLSLRDANLLKLQVKHGVDLKVPVVGKLMSGPMKWIDPENAAYYVRGKWPIRSVATVRMQSNALKIEVFKSASVVSGSPPGGSGGASGSNGAGGANTVPGIGGSGDLAGGTEPTVNSDAVGNSPVSGVDTIADNSTPAPPLDSLPHNPSNPNAPAQIPLPTADCVDGLVADGLIGNRLPNRTQFSSLVSTTAFRQRIAKGESLAF